MSRASECFRYCSNIFIINFYRYFCTAILCPKLISNLMISTSKLQACNLLENVLVQIVYILRHISIVEAHMIIFSRFTSKTKPYRRVTNTGLKSILNVNILKFLRWLPCSTLWISSEISKKKLKIQMNFF